MDVGQGAISLCMSVSFVPVTFVFACSHAVPQEHLHAMGIPQWPEYAAGAAWPWWHYKQPATCAKRLAGNVTRRESGVGIESSCDSCATLCSVSASQHGCTATLLIAVGLFAHDRDPTARQFMPQWPAACTLSFFAVCA